MLKIVALCLAAQAVAEDYTGAEFRWPDMLKSGGRIVQVLSSETNPKPAEWNYPKWYAKYPMRFVQEIPTPPGDEVESGELVILEYDITGKMGLGSDTLQKAANAMGMFGSFLMNKFSPKHNELGLIAKDKTGKEVGRYVFSLWPIGNEEIDDLSKDWRQKPREFNEAQLVTKNRAVVSAELSKANTWFGLPDDTKQIHVSNLNRQGYLKALQAVKDYAEQHQYFNDYEVTLPDGKVGMPAVTCNSLIEKVVQETSNQQAFDDGLGKMGYLALNVRAAKLNTVPTSRVMELVKQRKFFKDHYNKDLYIVPAYYDENGNPLPHGNSETPEQWYLLWANGVNWRQNYMKAEQFQMKQGIKKGKEVGMNLKQDLGYAPVVEAKEVPEAKPEVKGKKMMLKQK